MKFFFFCFKNLIIIWQSIGIDGIISRVVGGRIVASKLLELCLLVGLVVVLVALVVVVVV